ncbi:MAG: DUF6049 family protein, partial [Actinomycetia bacterium]|nr:DUF6049 family protein [Actinomycetes bacterium]
EVTLMGTVTNLTDAPMTGVQVTTWTANRAYTTPAALEDALTTPPRGARVYNDPHPTDPVGDGAGVLDAGVTLPFTVTVPTTGWSSLGLDTPGAAYLVGVRAQRAGTTLASADTVLSYPDPARPVHWLAAIHLSAPPSLIGPATPGEPARFANDDLAGALTSSLAARLQAGLIPGVTTVVDPLLWDEVRAMAAGYDVVDADGTTHPGTGQQAAQDWLANAMGLLARPGTYRGLYAAPDVAKAAAAGPADVLAQSQAALDPASPLASLPLAVWPKGGICDAATVAYVAPVAPSLLVCTNQTVPAPVTTAGWVTVLGVAPPTTDETLPPALDGQSQAAGALADARRLLAALAGRPPAVLLDGDAPTTPATALPAVLVPPSDVPPAGQPAFAAPEPAPAPASADLLAQTSGIEADLALAGDLSDQPAAMAALTARVVAGTWSGSWDSETAGLAWADRVAGGVRAQVAGGGLELRISPQWHLSARDTELPITIANRYGLPVKVSVHFTSDNPQRLSIGSTDLVEIAPGDSVTLRVNPVAAGTGTVPMTATVVTADGRAVGDPVPFTVVATIVGRLAWVIIVASGVAFLVATFLRVRQVRQHGRATRVPEIPDHDLNVI